MKILLCSDGSTFTENTYRYGAWFATHLQVDEVDVLCVSELRDRQATSVSNLSGSIGIDASENLLHRLVELEHQKAKLERQQAKLVLRAAAQALKTRGIDRIDLLHETGFLVDCLSKFEADYDLIVLEKRDEASQLASGQLGANIEKIVRSSHKPCLVTSQQFKPIERILIAYDGSPSNQKMLQFIADTSVFAGLELHIVTASDSAADETALAQIESAQQWLQQAGFRSICSVIEGHSEKVISDYISDRDISLLLMGAYGHRRVRQLVIGTLTAQMLRSSQIPVLLFR